MEVRLDTWLWSVRMYKSRSLASQAIKARKVKLHDESVKPSHIVKAGERYTLSIGSTKKIIEVLGLLEKRGSYEFAKKHYNDLTPAEEKEEFLSSAFFKSNIKRPKGEGRPTKKNRRDIENFNQ